MVKFKHRYSFTRLNDYSKCPQYYKFRNLDKIQTAEAEILTVGSVAHEIISAYTKECYKRKVSNLYDEWKDMAFNIIAENNTLEEYTEDIMFLVGEFVSANEIDLKGLAGVEEKVAIDSEGNQVEWDSEDAFFRSVLDLYYLLDTNANIIDYKTGYNFSPPKFQFEVYWWILCKVYPQLEECVATFRLVRFSTDRTQTFTKEDLPNIEKKIMAKIAVIEKDDKFEPRVSSWCENCQFWQKCPAMKGVEFKHLPKGKKESVALLQEVIALEKRLKEYKDMMKRFVEENGDVQTEDKIASFKTSPSFKWNVEKIIEWANTSGVFVLDALNGDTVKLKKIFKEDDMSRFCETKVSARFGITKIPAKKDAKE